MSNHVPNHPGPRERSVPEIVHTPALINPAGLAGFSGPQGAAFVPGPEGGEGGAGLGRYLHALRRRWLLSLVIALPLSAGATYLAWALQPQLYTAAAILQLAPIDTPLAFNTMDQERGGGTTFDVFKKTQKVMVSQRFLLSRALDPHKHPEVARTLTAIKSDADPEDWLQQHLSVNFPDDAQIMRVALTADDPAGLPEAVNAIIAEYYEAVVDSELKRKRDRIQHLEQAYANAESVLRGKRRDFAAIVEKVGTGDKSALTEVQKNELQRYGMYVQELTRIKVEMIETTTLLQHREEAMAAQDFKSLVAEADIAAAMSKDPVIRQYEFDRQKKIADAEALKARVNSARSQEVLRDLAVKQEEITQQINERRDELREELAERARGALAGELDGLRRRSELLKSQYAELEKEANRLQAEAKKTGQSSIEAEMMSVEIAAHQEIVNNLRVELERTKVEVQPKQNNQDPQHPSAPARITVLAPPPGKALPADTKTKLAMTIGAGAASFMLPFVVLVLFDASKNRISTGAEVTQAVGLSVIGAVPILPRRVMRRLNGPSENDKYWRSMLSESVDSIAAVLLRGSQPGTSRVIMVSSANAGEGKTTLAAHLAVSLAGAGRHPVLVDFDLRRPALHRVFGVSLSPGVNEILRDGHELESCLQATQVPHLMMLSAGRWSKTGLGGLVAADLQALFAQLRAGFDFVIVDACPILPVVDTRLIGQHVDAVLLSVLRDVSRTPKLRAACDLLDMFGIPVLGVVVTGSSEEIYKDSRYEPLSETQAV